MAYALHLRPSIAVFTTQLFMFSAVQTKHMQGIVQIAPSRPRDLVVIAGK
jgi:hypothetical protein